LNLLGEALDLRVRFCGHPLKAGCRLNSHVSLPLSFDLSCTHPVAFALSLSKHPISRVQASPEFVRLALSGNALSSQLRDAGPQLSRILLGRSSSLKLAVKLRQRNPFTQDAGCRGPLNKLRRRRPKRSSDAENVLDLRRATRTVILCSQSREQGRIELRGFRELGEGHPLLVQEGADASREISA